MGKLGTRGVGYQVDQLLGVIGEVLFSERQHKIALVGAGRLGEAIANSPIFAEQGITLAAISRTLDPSLFGRPAVCCTPSILARALRACVSPSAMSA